MFYTFHQNCNKNRPYLKSSAYRLPWKHLRFWNPPTFSFAVTLKPVFAVHRRRIIQRFRQALSAKQHTKPRFCFWWMGALLKMFVPTLLTSYPQGILLPLQTPVWALLPCVATVWDYFSLPELSEGRRGCRGTDSDPQLNVGSTADEQGRQPRSNNEAIRRSQSLDCRCCLLRQPVSVNDSVAGQVCWWCVVMIVCPKSGLL